MMVFTEGLGCLTLNALDRFSGCGLFYWFMVWVGLFDVSGLGLDIRLFSLTGLRLW